MTDIGLSQEQIDALLGGASDAPESGRANLSATEVAALADFERETMGNLPSVLNAMTGFEYLVSNIEYARTSPQELPEILGTDLIFAFPIAIGEPMVHFMAFEATFAKHVAASLMGAEEGDDKALSEMELSAITEVVSQANGSYLTNLSSALHSQVTGSTAELTDAGNAAAKLDDNALIASIYLGGGDQECVLVRHIIPGALASSVLAKVRQATEPPAHPAAPRVQPAPPAMASQATMQEQAMAQSAGPSTKALDTKQYSPATFGQLKAARGDVEPRNLDILLDVPLQVTVELGKTHIPIKQILEYGQGSLITLDKLAGEPIDLLVNGKYFAKGEVVVIDENFGVRIASILSPAERLAHLG